MTQLCFLSNLISSEWASRVQAVGSVLDIVAAARIARHQAKLQHRSALDLLRTERRTARVEVAETLAVLASNAARALAHVSDQLLDREAVSKVARGSIRCDIGEVQRIDGYLGAVPLHELPGQLVTLIMILGATVRQFREKVEVALRLHLEMDAAMFDDFFATLKQMNESPQATCNDITAQVEAYAK